MKGGRVNQNWCMGVVSYGYCGSGIEEVFCKRPGHRQEGLDECREMPMLFLSAR